MKRMLFVLCMLWILPIEAKDLYYLNPQSVDLALVPAPPEPGSGEDFSDLEMVLYYQGVRSEEDCHRAGFEDAGYSTSFFGEEYGPLTDEEAERLKDFQERLFQEVKYFSRILKEKNPRKRPFLRDARVRPCIPLQPSDSYPSGHAAIAMVAARTFGLIYPEKEKALLSRAKVIAHDRVIGGVHHPFDVLAGKVLGEMIFSSLLKEEKFLNDVRSHLP